MKKFRVKNYEICSSKMNTGKEVRFALMADLHGFEFGKENEDLIRAIRDEKPDAILVPGDMVIRSDVTSLEETEKMLATLAEEFPVYYSLGNHENQMVLNEEMKEKYLKYERALTAAGVCFLHNEYAETRIKGTDFLFYGLEIPMKYYHKPKSPKLTLKTMEELIGTPFRNGIHVLLAHNPKYGNTYFSWGADLTVCGHYHGGILRLGEHTGLTCPQFLLFPPYCCGDFHKGDRHMIVSAGLGEHTIPIRIHNPRELLMITIKAPEAKENS